MPVVGKTYHVYILASDRNGTLYIGVTGSLAHRIWQHRNDTADGFTKRYGVTKLVHAEEFGDIHLAIAREKALKKWRRIWKLDLIEQANPEWCDLFDDLS